MNIYFITTDIKYCLQYLDNTRNMPIANVISHVNILTDILNTTYMEVSNGTVFKIKT